MTINEELMTSMLAEPTASSKRASEEAKHVSHYNDSNTHTSKRRRTNAASDIDCTFQPSQVQDLKSTPSTAKLDERPGVSSRTNHVKAILEKELPHFEPLKTSPPQLSLDFQLVQSGMKLTREELDVCFNLIHTTSGDDYRASSIGWNPNQKIEEMRDLEMMYLLVRQGDAIEEADERSLSRDSTNMGEGMSATQPDALVQLVLSNASSNEEKPSATGKTIIPTFSRNANPILGFISFMFTHDDPPHQDREVVYIYEVHLDDALRGHGLGSHLVRCVEKVAHGSDVTKTMLTVFASNDKARRVYERLGYTKDACSPKDRVMRRKIVRADYVILSKVLL